MSEQTPQEAREMERRRWQWDVAISRVAEPAVADYVSPLIALADREHADLVKRAEDAEAREARLRAGIEALMGGFGHTDFCAGRFNFLVCTCWDARLQTLLATPDADAQDEVVS